MSDLTAEVRDALAAATPGPWEQSRGFPAIVYGADRNDIYSRPHEEVERNVHLIASAPSWLAALCDRLDAAEAKLAAVREMHRPVHLYHSRTGLVAEVPCPSCSGKAGTHECGCWGEYDRPVYCDACSQHSPLADYYPCPTIIALNGDPG